MNTIQRREWAFVIVFGLVIMALTCVPYILGATQSNDAWRFSGFVIGVEDGNSYLAKMQQGAHGQWLFQLSYAIEDHVPSLVFAFFILLGKFIGLIVGTSDPIRLHDALVVGFHVARVVFGFAMIAATYAFLAELLPRIRQRRIALVLASIGGGLDWLSIVIPNGGMPLELYSPETFGFLHLYSLPHLSLVRALMLLGLLFYIRALRGRWQWALLAGATWFVMTLVQPFYMVIVFGILGLHVVILGLLALRGELIHGLEVGASAVRALWVSIIAGAFGLPMVLYTFLLFIIDPIYQQWGAQNIILSPPVWHYVLAYGLVAILAVFGLRSLYRRSPLIWALMLGWLVLVPILLYVPYNLQRRFAEGVFVPLVGLAVLGLTIGVGKGRLRRKVSRLGPVALLMLSLPGTLLLWVGGLVTAVTPKEPAFQPQAAVVTYDFLARNLPPRAVVLSSYEFGNAVPAYGYLVAFMGHGPETPYLEEKREIVLTLFDPQTSDIDRINLYTTQGAPYLVIGPHERELGSFDPLTQMALQKLYDSNGYTVWSLIK